MDKPARSDEPATQVSSWQLALEDVACRLNQAEVTWMLVGSAATAVHGAAIEPGDIDIAISTAADVYAAATVLPSRTDQPADADPGIWHSTLSQPVLTWTDNMGTRWTFGRWTISHTKVELACLDPAEPSDAVIETGDVQSLAIELDWHDTHLRIVPIELQIGTMIVRDQQHRLRATLVANDVGDLDADLLRRTIADRKIETSDPRIPGDLRRLLVTNR